MMIEVELSEWEQQCCGDPFRLGSTVTWKLVARAPSQDAGAVQRYREEHHDQTPGDVEHLPVTGTVRTVQGLHYAFDEGPNPGELTVRPGSEVGVELGAVPGAGTQLPGCSAEHRLLTYCVQLEVVDDVDLPAYTFDGYAWVRRSGLIRTRAGPARCGRSGAPRPRPCSAMPPRPEPPSTVEGEPHRGG
jgi:hypothetical protein